jgi:hypothetical protein
VPQRLSARARRVRIRSFVCVAHRVELPSPSLALLANESHSADTCSGSARQARNPKTGEKMIVKAATVPAFSFGMRCVPRTAASFFHGPRPRQSLSSLCRIRSRAAHTCARRIPCCDADSCAGKSFKDAVKARGTGGSAQQ